MWVTRYIPNFSSFIPIKAWDIIRFSNFYTLSSISKPTLY
ncbi:hypothetical protein TASCI_50016 [Tenacibaculum ascidiaceicola]